MIEITDIAKYKPAGHKIVVRYEPTTTRGGLIIPNTVKTSKQGWFATVVSISPGADLKDAGCPDLEPGDIIDTDCILSACRTFDIGQDVYVVINDGDIIAVIEP